MSVTNKRETQENKLGWIACGGKFALQTRANVHREQACKHTGKNLDVWRACSLCSFTDKTMTHADLLHSHGYSRTPSWMCMRTFQDVRCWLWMNRTYYSMFALSQNRFWCRKCASLLLFYAYEDGGGETDGPKTQKLIRTNLSLNLRCRTLFSMHMWSLILFDLTVLFII